MGYICTQRDAPIANHLLTLGDALEAISDNARVPLQLYTSPD
ncbi:hypothetical protein [Trichocoleus sp. FACHB-90]|nr:hypothetical protein [Trichocoleus sp. FACHB-90]